MNLRAIPCGALALLGVILLAPAAESLEPSERSPAQVEQRVNRVRVDRHLKPLRRSRELARAAQQHADDMARNGYLSHTNLEGRNPLERVQTAGIEGFRLLAENIGESNIGESNIAGDRIAAVIEAWLASTAHRKNLLNPAFNHTGIGAAETPDGRSLFVQLFATY